MRHEGWRRVSRALELSLAVVGIVCLGRYAWLSYEGDRLESENRAAVSRLLTGVRPSPLVSGPAALSPEPSALGDPTVIGALDIPRLRVSAAVRVGDDEEVLAGAIGYLPDTPPPWEEGNTAFAAHRDRLFRPLEGIRAGDTIFVATRHGSFEYRVVRTFIASPRDLWVLDAVPDVDLTLLTCYPFSYVGHAPQRFVVRARKVLHGVRPGPDVERERDEHDS